MTADTSPEPAVITIRPEGTATMRNVTLFIASILMLVVLANIVAADVLGFSAVRGLSSTSAPAEADRSSCSLPVAGTCQ